MCAARAEPNARIGSKSSIQADEDHKRLIDEEYTRHPFYSSKNMIYFERCGHKVNHKRVERLIVPLRAAWHAGGARQLAWLGGAFDLDIC